MALKHKFTQRAGETIGFDAGERVPEFAISASYVLKDDFDRPDAYWQVSGTMIDKASGVANLVVYQDATKSRVLRMMSQEFPYDLDGGNPIAQAYEHLKTLPEFADAEDC